MENIQVNFEQPLLHLKEEIDRIDLKIVGCRDNMQALKSYVEEYSANKTMRKNLLHEKREKERTLTVICDFYKKATGKEPDGIYPLFSQQDDAPVLSEAIVGGAQEVKKNPTIHTNSAYWDCNCEEDYIHSIKERICLKCGAVSKDQPDSRQNEIDEMLKKNNNKN